MLNADDFITRARNSQLGRALLGLQALLPTDLNHRLMCYRRLPHWRAAGLVFIHVPKAAGTSINHALYGRSMGHMKAREIQRYCPGLLKSLPSFAVVRNPWSRLVSAYLFVRQAGTDDAGVHRPARYLAHEFRSFEAFVEEWLINQDLDQLDYVFQSQHRFVDNASGEQLVEFVGTVEQMSAVSNYVAQKIGRRVIFPQKNLSRRDADYRTYFNSNQLIQRVGDLYTADVQRFGYDF